VVVDVRHDLERAAAAAAPQRIRLIHNQVVRDLAHAIPVDHAQPALSLIEVPWDT
jgi:hypothetical protein